MKRMSAYLLWMGCLLALMACCRPAAAATRARVSADNVNLRADQSLKSEVVGQVNEGDELPVVAISGKWVEIKPPEQISFWVHRDFVSGGEVKARNLRVRAGPGINYTIVGSLKRGDKVQPRGEFGDWLKIVPPSGTTLWVSRKLVEIVRPSQPQPHRVRRTVRLPVSSVRQAQIASATQQTVHATTGRIPPPRATARSAEKTTPETTSQPPPRRIAPPRASDLKPEWKLIPLEGQGKSVEREGILRKFGFLSSRPTRFRLISTEGTHVETLCYIRGNEAQLQEYTDQPLRIKGREYWIRGCDYAILVVDQVVPLLQNYYNGN
jgi:uncharacterized protein YgiM (DUF1202 family)